MGERESGESGNAGKWETGHGFWAGEYEGLPVARSVVSASQHSILIKARG